MENQTIPDEFRAGFVAIAGRPNVGKSTLINRLLGQVIAAVTPRPQTTRRKQLGILSLEKAQVVLVDTPGVHRAHNKLGELMNREAGNAFHEVDVLLVLVDGSEPPQDEDRLLAEMVSAQTTQPDAPKVVLAVNKIDLVPPAELAGRFAAFQAVFPGASLLGISAERGDGIAELLAALVARLPISDAYFPDDQVTDLYEREIAADLVRAAALLHLRDEVPHAIAVRIDEYTEREDHGAHVSATLFVERESQKGIVIGRGGAQLKQIGSTARKAIEEMSGRKVFLDLRVKVRANWRNDEKVLRKFGFAGRSGESSLDDDE